MRLQGDAGARRLIGSLGAGELIEVEASDAGVVVDIDTPATLRRPGGCEATAVDARNEIQAERNEIRIQRNKIKAGRNKNKTSFWSLGLDFSTANTKAPCRG